MNTPYEQPPYNFLESYDDIEAIRRQFAPLANINKDHKITNLDQSLFFVIRTQGEDNVHRAMKYGVWTSSSRKNQKLSEAYRQVKKQGGDIFLFYTEINSLCFSGVAKLTSDFDEKGHFKFWLVENKWFGSFKIEWLYVKDMDFSTFETLRQTQALEGSREVLKPVHDLIDCTELLKENGKKMLEIFNSQQQEKSLFSDFKHLDSVEKQCREQRVEGSKFDKKFYELVKVFEQIPFSFSVASYERRKLHRKQSQMYIQQFYYNPYTVQQYYQQQYYQQYLPPTYGYGNQQQQQYPQQPQSQQYWQNNNGFYHQQNQPAQQYDRNPQQQEEQVNPESDQPVQNRFAVKGGKKPKTEKRFTGNKKGSTKYVAKQDYHPDPNFVHIPQPDSEEETVQQQDQS